MLTDGELEKLQNEVNEQIELIKKEENEYNRMVENSKRQNNISDLMVNFEELYSVMDIEEKIEFLNTIIKTIKVDVTATKVKTQRRYIFNIVDIIFK